MSKFYTLSIVEHDTDTGEDTVLHEDDYNSIAMVGTFHKSKDEGEPATEILVNTSVREVSALISSSTAMKKAAHIASIIDMAISARYDYMEDVLTKAVEGGIQ